MAKLTPDKIHTLFKLLYDTPSQAELLGYTPGVHPEYMILQNLLVLPAPYRPPRIIGDKVTHNDLTFIYQEIVKICAQISQKKYTADEEEKAIDLLYTTVSTLFNNSNGGFSYRNGRPHRTLKCLMTGKGRLIRGYTQGKRVNFCIRSVASPDPSLRLRQVGVPLSLAREVTYPEWVDEINIVRLQRYMDNGQVIRLTKATGKYKGRNLTVASLTGDMEVVKQLEMGDKVDRWLMGPRVEDGVEYQGDWVMVNRQPTLHKGSIFGLEVVIGDWETIRLNVNYCGSYGADFDGDEIKLSLKQVAA